MRHDLTGVWLSRYRYLSSSREREFEGKHYVRILREGRFLVAESVPEVSESYLLMRLAVDDEVVTGSWHEETNPNGYYKGAMYHGAIQLLLNKGHDHMRGQWIGFGKDQQINAGLWELTYIGDSVPAS